MIPVDESCDEASDSEYRTNSDNDGNVVTRAY